ncbi:MAG: hypothetical protein ACI31R_02830 [Bacilli bacterium]
MRIGIDLDNTIFCTDEQYKKYQSLYLKEKNITEHELWNIRKNRVDYIKKNLNLIFSDVKLKKDVLVNLNKLINDGNEIYIISARSKEYCENMYEFTEKSLKQYNIPYKRLILTEKYKKKECLENKIDLMIDDSIDIYNELKDSIKVIIFDDKNKYKDIKNRVTNWNELFLKIRRNEI